MLLAQLAVLNLDDTIQSSEYVGRVCLVVRVLQQALALIWSRTQCYLHTRRLRNGISVHRFVHGIGEVALQVIDNVSLKMQHLTTFQSPPYHPRGQTVALHLHHRGTWD